MRISYYGHSCFEVESEGKKILFDPFISSNPLAENVDLNELNPDFILISHGHGDHVADVETIAKQSDARLVSTFEVISWFQQNGVDNGHAMNHGGTVDLGHARAKMVNAVHSSSMPDGSYGGNPVGFVVSTEGKSFYYAGDTALTLDMQLIGEEFDIDFAFLPIGDNFTMGLTDALKAARMVGTSRVIGMHYDTFPVIAIDKTKSIEEASDSGVELTLIPVGEHITI